MSKYRNRASLPVNFEGLINARCPQDVFTFFDDFMSCSWSKDDDSVSMVSTTAGQRWHYSSIGDSGGGASIVCVDADDLYLSTLGGIMRVTTKASTDDGANLQANGTQFLIDKDSGLPLYFETRFRSSDIGNTDAFIGLADVDIEICTTGADDAIGFLLESEVLYAHSAKNSLEKSVDTCITEADGAAASNTGWIRAAFYFDGKETVSFFVDGNDDGKFDFVTSLTVETTLDYVSDDECMTPTIEVIAGTTHSAGVLDVDYVYVAQQRYHA